MEQHRLTLQKNTGRKLFWSVLVTYLLLLAVTLLLLAGGYFYSLRQARQDVETLQISFLEQVRRELDIRLSSVSRISNFLAQYPLTQSVSGIREEEVGYQLDYRMLDEVILEQNSLLSGEGETVVYFDASDSVLTGTYRYRSVNLDAYTRQLGLSPEEFRDFLPDKVTNGELCILRPNTAEAELVYMVPIINDAYRKVGTVMTRVSMEYLKKAVNAEHWREGSICHMQSGSDQLYIDSGSYGEAVLEANLLDYESVPLDTSPVRVDIDGEEYLTVGLCSAEHSWNYYFSVPMREFTRSSAIYAALFAATLCLSVFTGVVMSLYFSQRVSRPIEGILDALRLDSAVAYPKAVSSLEEALLSYRKEMSVTQHQIRQGLRRKRADFVYGLCTGRTPLDKLEEGMEEFGFTLERGPVSLIVFCYHQVEGPVFTQDGVLDQDMMLYAGGNVIEELLCPEKGVTAAHGRRIVCLHQPEGEPDEEALRETLKEIYDFHQDVLQVGLRIYCAGRGESLAELTEMLSMAEEMDRYKVFWENNVPDILFPDEISDLSGSTSLSLGVENRFLNLLAIGNYQEAHQVLTEQLGSGISKDFKRFQRERYRIYGFISTLVENLPAPAEEGEMEELTAALDGLLAAQSLSALREQADVVFQCMIRVRQEEAGPADAPGWVRGVQGYIEEHYADPQLGVSHIAKEFSLNISYLSRTYKKTTSIGVLDNIHMVRIGKAKELLGQGCTVQEASVEVGYLESRALIRAFKRYEGITPGQYQEMLKQKG